MAESDKAERNRARGSIRAFATQLVKLGGNLRHLVRGELDDDTLMLIRRALDGLRAALDDINPILPN